MRRSKKIWTLKGMKKEIEELKTAVQYRDETIEELGASVKHIKRKKNQGHI